MTTAKHLLQTLKAFHLDNPEASWGELRDNLRDIAEEALGNPQGEAYGLVLSEVSENLAEIAETMPMSLPQAQAVLMAQRVLTAAQGRHSGDLRALVELLNGDLKGSIDKDNQDRTFDSKDLVSASICKSLSTGISQETSTATTFQSLYDAFKAERGGDKSDNTLKNWKSCTSTIVGHLKDADMAKHTRATFVGLRDALLAGGEHKPSSINKIMTHASSVIGWAVATGLIERDYTKKLSITKGSESARTAFTGDHLKTLRAWAMGNLGEDWKASAIALGVATGARIGEIHQLTGSDIYKDNGQWVMDINDKNGKTLKNSFSRRIVPLLGIPEDHLEKLSQTQGRLFTQSKSGFDQLVNQIIRDLLGTKAGGGLSFHSLRHSMASDLKAAGVSVGIAQAILGHSSGSLAFDLYGGNAAASRGLMVEALMLVR
ncbi:tyrosine-type recombinase/integrase [Pseudomonas putida]|uniref:tyrosine-type recombinase/integrase n=1 Tax=Pseudomonas putida TaxID=303 RepID=UPI00288C228D|nr:tyrosine-type recombinase/integrase [Pseudomonas putida]WNI10582.1 tyrosine-type recombinase/integrase [Pseudomonas putida]